MPTVEEFQATNTPWQEHMKCRSLSTLIRRTYEPNATTKSALATLATLAAQWRARYDAEIAAATNIDDLPSSVTSQITALQSTYDNYSG